MRRWEILLQDQFFQTKQKDDQCLSNFGELLECLSLFRNNSKIWLYSWSNSMPNSRQRLDSSKNWVATPIIGFYNSCFKGFHYQASTRLRYRITFKRYIFILNFWKIIPCQDLNPRHLGYHAGVLPIELSRLGSWRNIPFRYAISRKIWIKTKQLPGIFFYLVSLFTFRLILHDSQAQITLIWQN